MMKSIIKQSVLIALMALLLLHTPMSAFAAAAADGEPRPRGVSLACQSEERLRQSEEYFAGRVRMFFPENSDIRRRDPEGSRRKLKQYQDALRAVEAELAQPDRQELPYRYLSCSNEQLKTYASRYSDDFRDTRPLIAEARKSGIDIVDIGGKGIVEGPVMMAVEELEKGFEEFRKIVAELNRRQVEKIQAAEQANPAAAPQE